MRTREMKNLFDPQSGQPSKAQAKTATRSNASLIRGSMIGFLIAAVLAIGACTKKEDKVLFDGLYFPADAKVENKADRKMFKVSVRRAQQNFSAALDAAQHEGKTFCLKNFGTSEIEWRQGPDEVGAADVLKGDRLTLTGTCVLW